MVCVCMCVCVVCVHVCKHVFMTLCVCDYGGWVQRYVCVYVNVMHVNVLVSLY